MIRLENAANSIKFNNLREQHRFKRKRDHDHITGKYRGAARVVCNLNVKSSCTQFLSMVLHHMIG